MGFTLAQLLLAMLFFRQFALMHEAVHGNVCHSGSLNTLVGILAGVFCFLPFESWRRLHQEHHLWAGNVENDPSSKLRREYDPKRRVKYGILNLIWKSWIPIMGLLQQVVFWLYPIQQIRNRSLRPRIKVSIVASTLLPLAVYVTCGSLWPNLFQLRNFAAAIVLYLMLVELINFPHHMDVYAYKGTDRMPVLQQHRVTRSSSYPLWFSNFFLLNFNLHVEHHLFPTLPWYQLPQAQEFLKPALGGEYNESIANEWIVKNRKLSLDQLLPVTEALGPSPDATAGS